MPIDSTRSSGMDSRVAFGDVSSFFRLPIVLICASIAFLAVSLFLLYSSTKPVEPIRFSVASDGNTADSSGARSDFVTVDIGGAVVAPGVYTLSKGARINDAIAAAGGFEDDADIQSVERQMNRAAVIHDGAKIVIPGIINNSSGEKTTLGQNNPVVGITASEGLININTASSALLEELIGIGPVTAKKIVDGRPYVSLEELVARKIISASVLEKIRAEITL